MKKEKNTIEDISGDLNFRMERSVMTRNNYDDISAISGDSVPFSLLLYLCYEHQANVFGYGIFDPDDFAKRFKFDRYYLQRSHPDPYQKRIMNTDRIEKKNLRLRTALDGIDGNQMACCSRIENALFMLANHPLMMTVTTVRDDNMLVRHEHTFLRVLDSFGVIQERRKGKTYYTYKLSDNFRRNLSSLYSTYNVNSLIGLRKTNLEPLYAFLVSFRGVLFSKGLTSNDAASAPQFDFLCRLADVPQYTEPKYRKRDLNSALQKVRKSTELEFSVEWVKGTGAAKFVPIFHFDIAPSLISSPHARKVEAAQVRRNVAVNEFLHNLVLMWPDSEDRFSSNAEDVFVSWLAKNAESKKEQIRYALDSTFINLGCGLPRDVDERVDKFVFLLNRKGNSCRLSSWVGDLFTSVADGFNIPPFRCTDGSL